DRLHPWRILVPEETSTKCHTTPGVPASSRKEISSKGSHDVDDLGKDIKVKKSKNQQEMKRQVQERDMRKDIKAGSARRKKVKSMKTQLKSKD
ncbi:hypothetical protein Tco_0931016, partial [Tanacetum coccineum]